MKVPDFFRTFHRIPGIDLARLPFRAEVGNFRHYTFWVDFSDLSHQQGLANVIAHAVREDRRAQRASYQFLQKAEVTPHIQEFQSRRAAEGGYPPDYVDLFYLYSHIRAGRPRLLLEYGSGISTLVMALALEQNGEGNLVSVEPSEEWANSTRSALPAHLLQRAEVIYSPGITCELGGRNTVRFVEQPVAAPDLIYIDGAPEGASYAGAENIAALEGSFGTKSVTIFVDARREALNFFNSPQRKARYEVASYVVDVVDLRTERRLFLPLGLDQFSNSMIRWRG